MDREQILQSLRADLDASRQRCDVASERFDAIIREVPSGLPHLAERIRRASREYTQAQEAVSDLLVKVTDYLSRGTATTDPKARRKAPGSQQPIPRADEKTG